MGAADGAGGAAAVRTYWEREDVDFIVSTGGEAGRFWCATTEGMERFLAHIASPHLLGVDFDIEGTPDPADIDSLVRQVAAAAQRHPQLRWSFTLATLAAADGSSASINASGRQVLAAVRASGLQGALINLMVMDYGPPTAASCVVSAGVCDMGRSAQQAVENLHTRFAVPYAQIEVTPMIGVNDSPGNVFTIGDAEMLGAFVRTRGLAGLHYWSMDRDSPCSAVAARADCSGLPDVPPGAFGATFLRVLSGASASGGRTNPSRP